MAEFSKEIPLQTNMPNWYQFIRGPSKDEVIKSKQGNMDEAIKGVGNAISGAANVTNRYFEEGAKKDTQAALEKARNTGYGVQEATDAVKAGKPLLGAKGDTSLPNVFAEGDFTKTPNAEDIEGAYGAADDALPSVFDTPPSKPAKIKGAPPGVGLAEKQLQTYQKAYESGNVSPTHYWAHMNAIVGQLRTMYPGYTDEVDAMAAKVTGGVPANELRKALLSDMDALHKAQGSAANKPLQYIESHSEQLREALGPDWQNHPQVRAGNMEFLIKNVSEVQYQKADVEHQMAKINLKKAQGLDVSDETVRMATNYADTIGTNHITNFFSDPTWKDAMTKASSGTMDANQQAQMSAFFNRKKAEGVVQMDQFLNRTDLPNEERNKLRTQYAQRWDAVHGMIANKETGMLAATENWNKANREDNTGFLRRAFPDLTTVENIAKMVPQLGIEQMTNASDGKILTTIGKAYTISSVANAQKNAGNGASLSGDVEKIIKNDTETGNKDATGNLQKNLLDAHLDAILHPDHGWTPQQREQALRAVFLNDGVGSKPYLDQFKLSPDQKVALFNRIASPDVVKQAYEIAQRDPKMLNGMDAWLRRNFVSVAAPNITDLNSLRDGSNTESMKLKFNPSTFQIESEDPRGIQTSRLLSNMRGSATDPRASYVTRVNHALESMKPWVEKTKQDPTHFVADVLVNDFGIDGNPESPAKGQSVLEDMTKGLVKEILAAKKAEEDKKAKAAEGNKKKSPESSE